MAARKPVAEQAPGQRPMCRTREECFQAGWNDGANDRPLSQAEIEKIAALWRPYFRVNQQSA